MTTPNYAVMVTLIDAQSGTPLIRCWGPPFDPTTTTGWHNFLISFDSAEPRVQIAMDGGGGPILGGGPCDTLAGTGHLSGGSFPTPTPSAGTTQPMYCTLRGSDNQGFNPAPGVVADGPAFQWFIGADAAVTTEFAYCYFGIPRSELFFDLTAPINPDGDPNTDYFIPLLTAPDWNPGAGTIFPLIPLIAHSGNTQAQVGDVLYVNPPTWQPDILYNWSDKVTWDGIVYQAVANPPSSQEFSPVAPEFFPGIGILTYRGQSSLILGFVLVDSQGNVIPNLDRQPDLYVTSGPDDPKFWMEVHEGLFSGGFLYNAAAEDDTRIVWTLSGSWADASPPPQPA